MERNMACAAPGGRTTLPPQGVPHITTQARLPTIVARAFGLTLDDLAGVTRGCAQAALARQTVMYLARVSLGLTLSQAARLCGRDRTTAAHACRVIEDRRDDPFFDARLAALEAILARNPDAWR